MSEIKPTEVAAAIRMLRVFRRGVLHGQTYFVCSLVPDRGDLPAKYASELQGAQQRRHDEYMANGTREAMRERVPDAPAYVVYSGGTPVAWLTLDGTIHAPAVWRGDPVKERHRVMARDALRRTSAEYVHVFGQNG